MRVKKSQAGIGFFLGVFILLFAIVAALMPSIYGRTRYGLANTLRDYPSKLLDLSERSHLSPIRVAGDLVPALLEGRFPANLEELRLDIKFKHFQKIQEDRGEAIEAGILREPVSVPGRLEYRYQRYRAKVRLKGRLTDHWMGPDRWSLRVRLRGGETIKGFNQFSLQRPRVRQLPFDQLFQFWGRQLGGLTPDFEFFRLYVNGDYWGRALAEEHMSKHFLEANRRKESALIKLESVDRWYYEIVNREISNLPEAYYGLPDVGLYSEGSYLDDARMRTLFSYAAEQYRKVIQGEAPITSLIDIPAFARSFMTAMAWNHQHSLADSNSRYYLNPYTLLLEPVTTDQTQYFPINRDDVFSNAPFSENGAHLPPLYQRLIQEGAFYDEFSPTLDEMKKVLPSLKDEHQRICEPFPFDCPDYQEEVLRDNIAWLEESGKPFIRQLGHLLLESEVSQSRGNRFLASTPPMAEVEYPEHIYATYREDGRLRIYNLLSHEVEVEDIRIVCEFDASAHPAGEDECLGGPLLRQPLVLASGKIGRFPFFQDMKLAAGHLNDSRYLVITTALGGELRETIVRLSLVTDLMNPLIDRPVFGASGELPQYATTDGDTIRIGPGDWKVDAPLIFPKGHEVVLVPGTTLRFSRDAYLLVRGGLRAEGTETSPIVLTAQADSWKGLYVLQAGEVSRLRHIRFEKVDFLEDGVLQLTGGVSFYQSDVEMEDVVFEGSLAEDALNIIESEFEIRNSIFEDIRSDAFDSDYAKGMLSDSVFRRIGGDGLDTSGSEVLGERLVFEGVVDKAVSAGEGSEVRLDTVVVRDVGAAMVSKDGSNLSIKNLSVSGAKIASGMVYRKKSLYGSARLLVFSSDIDQGSFYNQVGNELIVNGTPIEGIELDVEALYREGPMKKVRREEVEVQ
jgi:hypothetical protein